MCTSVRCTNHRWAGNTKWGWEVRNVGSYTGGLGFKSFWKGSAVFELWCKATWLWAQLGILVRGPTVQGKCSKCPILGGVIAPSRIIYSAWCTGILATAFPLTMTSCGAWNNPWEEPVVCRRRCCAWLWGKGWEMPSFCVPPPGCGTYINSFLIGLAKSDLTPAQFLASNLQVHLYKFTHEGF